ncbi:MAG: hypothetical protein CFE26_20870, partial [Verrucomicrobiales bacterium VVV1]
MLVATDFVRQLRRVADEIETEPADDLIRAIEAGDGSGLLQAAGQLHYADLAHLYENLNDGERDFLMKTIGPERATDVIAELPHSLVEDALHHFKPAQLRFLLANLS